MTPTSSGFVGKCEWNALWLRDVRAMVNENEKPNSEVAAAAMWATASIVSADGKRGKQRGIPSCTSTSPAMRPLRAHSHASSLSARSHFACSPPRSGAALPNKCVGSLEHPCCGFLQPRGRKVLLFPSFEFCLHHRQRLLRIQHSPSLLACERIRDPPPAKLRGGSDAEQRIRAGAGAHRRGHARLVRIPSQVSLKSHHRIISQG